MADITFAALFALFAWWFSTGAVLYLVGLPPATFRWSMAGATALAAAAVYGLATTATDTSITGAYVAFLCGLLIWAWHETSFLLGWVTGPRNDECPQGATGWARFRYATETIIHHELAILATGIALLGLTWDAPNQVGFLTFAVLWAMRISAKLNVFLGAANLTEEFLPPHLVYLKSYFRTAPMNLLFPVSISAATALTVILAQGAVAPGASPFDVTAFALLATMTALGLIEHWLLMVPLPAAALWGWGLSSRKRFLEAQPAASCVINFRTVQNTGLHPVVTRAAGRT